MKKTRINDQITVHQVRLIGEKGDQIGILATSDALQKAKEEGLDLVEISPNSEPPVCRLMDYGKYIFELRKRKGGQVKKQKKVQLKEVKFRPTTDIGDFTIKVKKILQFLERGDKVKVSLRFRGREMQHKQLGMDLLERVKAALPENLVVEQEPLLEGRQMSMALSLAKTKT